MEKGFCDRCGIELDKYHNLRIILQSGDWDNSFDLCNDCYNYWLDELGNREFIEATWSPKLRLLKG